MYKKELLDTIKEQGKGLIFTKRAYKIILKEEKDANKDYQYSLINSIVYDGNMVKIGYDNYPRNSKDFYARYTNLKSVEMPLEEINSLTFVK